MLNDFGFALRPSNARVAPPAGTLVCAAKAILDARRAGIEITPLPEHDLEACAKLLYSMFDTVAYLSLQRVAGDHPEREIQQIWDSLSAVSFFKNLIDATQARSYANLKARVAEFLAPQ
jgi:hypothetical protein